MSKKETFKDIVLAGKKYRVVKFDALTGSFIAYQVMTKMLPAIMKMQSASPEQQAAGIMSGAQSMGKEEFIAFQKDCLSVCYEMQNVGGQEVPSPVIMADGRLAVAELKEDVMTVLSLTIHALLFNVTSFFDENALKSAMESLSGSSLFSAKT